MADRRQPRRKSSIRLRGWDYTSPGFYFVTICTHQREHLFENENFRAAVEGLWRRIPTRPQARDHVRLDESVLMPDHFHGILELFDYPPGWPSKRSKGLQPGSVSAIVGTFKSMVAKRINIVRGTLREKVWQRGYYDKIIWDAEQLTETRKYIRDNPERWNKNRDNLDTYLPEMREVWWVD